MIHLLPLLLLFGPAAHAQDAARADPPLPIAGEPWSALISAYALPPQDVSWLTEDVPELRCSVSVAIQPDGSFAASASACPARMGEAAALATQSWTFQAPSGATGQSRLQVDYVLQYSSTIGTTTLHAEVDPGADHTAEEGVPGLQLIHRAAPRALLGGRLPKSAKKAGLGAQMCRIRVGVDAQGRAANTSVAACPVPLVEDAVARARKARYAPKTVDGMPYSDQIDVQVSYTR